MTLKVTWNRGYWNHFQVLSEDASASCSMCWLRMLWVLFIYLRKALSSCFHNYVYALYQCNRCLISYISVLKSFCLTIPSFFIGVSTSNGFFQCLISQHSNPSSENAGLPGALPRRLFTLSFGLMKTIWMRIGSYGNPVIWWVLMLKLLPYNFMLE